jgi:hypothetical protein
MTDGAIVQKSGLKPQGFAGNILGNLDVTGGEIRFESMVGIDDHEFGEFLVNGDVIWKGGTFMPYVSSVSTDEYDQWHATGAFAINTPNGTAALLPTAVDGTGVVVTPDAGMTWEILKADGSFVNDNKPSFDNNTWALDPVDNPQTVWKLRKT